MLNTPTNSACSKHTVATAISRASELFANWTAAQTTFLTTLKRPSGGLESKEKSTWPSWLGNSANVYWECCSQKWMVLRKKEGMIYIYFCFVCMHMLYEWMEWAKAFSPALEHKFQVIINNFARLLHGFIITNDIWMYRYVAYALKIGALCCPFFCWCWPFKP